MRKQRHEAAQDVAERLFEAETAIDLAIARASELAASLPVARQSANLSAVVGQKAFTSAAGILPALAQAREQIVATHRNLDETKADIGLGPVSFGVPDGKPHRKMGLHVVDDEAA